MSGWSYCARAVLTAAASFAIVACGDDPQVPTTAVVVEGSALAGRVSVVLQQAPSVRVTDKKGRNIKGLLVRWRVTSGGGRVSSDTVRTDVGGVASSGGWVLGSTAGTQTLEAAVDGLPPTVFTATALPGPLAKLQLLSPDNQTTSVATPVPVAPSVRAEDQYGNPTPGLPVTFALVQGNGSITGATQTTNAAGVVTLSSWTLGTAAGPQRIRATATDAVNGSAASVDVAAIARPGPAARLTKIVGDNQIGTFGNPVPNPPGVRVVDQFGNGVGNIPVTFTPGPKSGSVSSGTVSSDPANGSAFVGAWTLDTAATTQTLVAKSPSIPADSVTFTASASRSQFDIQVRFIGPTPRAAVQQAFATAVARWKTAIVGDLQRTIVNRSAGACDSWIPAINETIDDVVIFARIDSIDHRGDGNGNILGQAGPCAVNSGTNLTAYGAMEFDSLDLGDLVADGSLTDVIVHEMGHVLGIGTLWNYRRTLLSGDGSSDPFFTGTAARTQFAELNTVTYAGTPVPVENSGGAGTRDAHWRESVLRNELMTGFLNRGSNPLSRISIASLRDMGYTVNLTAADPYTLTAALYRFPLIDTSDRRLYQDVKRLPLEVIDAQGRATRARY
jgi:hypothetical protein